MSKKSETFGLSPTAAEMGVADAERLLKAFLWIQLVAFAVYLVGSTAVEPRLFPRFFVQSGSGTALILSLLFLVRLGRVRLAAVCCILFAWALITASAYTGGGIGGAATSAYVLTVLIAGMLAGDVAAIVTAGVCMLTGLALVFLEAHGGLPKSAVSNSPLDIWSNLAILCAITAAVQSLANRTLRASERRYRSLVQGARDAIFTLTPDGVFSSVNPAFETITGWRTVDSIGQPFQNVIATPVAQEAWAAFLAAPEGVQRDSIALPIRRREGGTVTLDLNVALSRDPTVATLGIGRNITGRKEEEEKRAQLEVQLRQSQKMEAVGTLAGGIAHDFNNVLTAIVGHAQLLKDDAKAGSLAQERSGEILRAGARARDVVRQLLTFARSNVHERRIIRLPAVVREALQLMRASVPASIEMEVKLDAAAPPVLADPTQIHQVVVNLIANAASAMRDRGGRLTVSLEEVVISDALASPVLPRGRYVRLSVVDTGHGMDERVLERIFEPFFTTKPEGEGTGLGLAVVHSIIQDHEGHLNVQSKPGTGTTLEVYFPALEAERVSLDPGPLSEIPRGRGERLLIIDDEPAIGRVLAEQLERLGYKVTTSTDPEEALEVLAEDPADFDLAITDLQMPRMDGVELAARVAAMRPGFPVLLITGNRMSIHSNIVRAAGVREVLDKPFPIRELSRAIRSALDDRGKVPLANPIDASTGAVGRDEK